MTKQAKAIYIKLGFLLFAIILLGGSCKVIKTPDGISMRKRSPEYLLKKMNQNKLDLEWFSSKAKIRYEGEDQSISFSSNIRLRKDSALWMNFKKFGIEAVRVLINQDSIYILDRFNKQYAVKGFDYIESMFSLPGGAGTQAFNFAALQNFLLGNPQFFAVKALKASIDNFKYQLTGNYDNLSSLYQLEPANYQLQKMAFEDTKDKRSFKIDFTNYKELNNKEDFSYIRNFNLYSKTTGSISIAIKFSNIEINTPKSVRFNIPSHYKKMD